MADGVLPALPIDGVVAEVGDNPAVNVGQRHLPLRRGVNRHSDQSYVGVGRLLGLGGVAASHIFNLVFLPIFHLFWQLFPTDVTCCYLLPGSRGLAGQGLAGRRDEE